MPSLKPDSVQPAGRLRCRALISLLLPAVLALVCAQPALADDTWTERQWLLPAPDIQKDMDATLVPVGRGAAFVPCMSNPELEPKWELWLGDKVVGAAPAGQRIVARPGEYTAVVGSGATRERLRRKVVVREGKTSMVEVNWGGLRVEVVDETLIPFRGSYELVALPSKESFGLGSGARREYGERLGTWIVQPGLYMLLRPGESYHARKNFYTFRIRPGYLERVTLVLDPDTGEFKGGGELMSLGIGGGDERDLNGSLILGAGVSFNSHSNVTGAKNGVGLDLTGFVKGTLLFARKNHLLYGRLIVDESYTQEDWKRFEKLKDDLRLEGVYAYRFFSLFGPYVGLGYETSVFPGFLYFDSQKTVAMGTGEDTKILASNVKEHRISDAFFPSTLKGGAGLRLNTPHSAVIDLTVQLGVGGRYTFTDDMLAEYDDSETDNLEVRTVPSFGDVGIEAMVFLRANLARWLHLHTEFESFFPFDDFAAPTIRLDADIALRVTSFLSVDYTYRLEYEPDISPDVQQIHQVTLQFYYNFF